ncbi:MAG: alpha/beta hydrolase [Proteobacteria bacterium]|nr:alpha/beta hydrolase [Pseudomonadota bacterium]
MKSIMSDDGTVVTCQESGEGSPLLIVHGTSSVHHNWQFVADRLMKHFKVYVMDRRGRCQSKDHPEYSIEKEFADVAAVLNSFDDPVYVLGHSFGGLCTLGASLLVSNVRELILYEPAIAFDVKGLAFCYIMETMLKADRPEAALKFFMKKIVRMSDEEIEFTKNQPEWKERLIAAPTIPREIRALIHYNYSAESFSSIQIPTTIFVGENSSEILKNMVSKVQATISNSKIVELPGQGHISMLTAPDMLAEQVLKTLMPGTLYPK